MALSISIQIVLGLIWGAAVALVNAKISANALKKNDTKAVQTASYARMAVDIAALGLVFLAGKLLSRSLDIMLVATAITMSLVTMFFAFRMSKAEKKRNTPKT